ncbi:hypothetical protein ACFL55_01255 [Candidatus Latescibacterota bacterium]
MKRRWKVLITIVICATIFVGAILTVHSLKESVKAFIREKVSTLAENKIIQNVILNTVTVHHPTILPSDRLSARRHIVASLHKSLERGDLVQAALLNSILAQEAFQRAYRALKAWEELRDYETDLVPRATHLKMDYWDSKDTAADLFPFLLLASQYLDKDNEQLWLNTLAKEREICGPLPCTVHFQPTKVIAEDLSAIIFGASEYAKDGLLAVTERSGRGPWFERLEEIMHALIDTAFVETKSGKICSSSTEVNGEMLQVLSRLYWATQKDEYLHMAECIAEAYFFDILPKSQYLPPSDWNFTEGEPASSSFRFRDHGNEILAGLAELYLLEKIQGRPQAARYREAMKKLLDQILVVGRTENGLWYNTVDIKTHEPLDKGIIDTWGYILTAYQMFDIAEGTSLYSDEIKRTMRSAAALKSFTWEGTHNDGYADTIESMLYLLPWFDISESHHWVDDEIEVMFHMQSPSGFIEEGYLDGNFIRTSLLYAAYKTQGVLADPWCEDVYLGAVYDRDEKKLYVYFSADTQWKGVLKFDSPRHQTIWNLPVEYPRLNGTPEWFVVELQKNYVVVNLSTGEKSFHTGQSLAKGLAITMDEKDFPLQLMVSEE